MVEEPIANKEEKVVEDRASKVKRYLSDNTNLILVLLIAITVLVRLYYFFKLGNQPIWWDEGDYLAIARVWATGQPTPEWWSHFTGMRPLLLPLVWAALFKIGIGELMIRFVTILIPSVGSVFVCYLLGKELYDKKIGIISAAMMSFYWVFFFYSYRLLTDIPAVFLGLLSLYFFWAKYIKENKTYGLYLCFIFGVLAFSTRFSFALVPISCAVYLLLVKKTKILKDKVVWKGALVGFLALLPYIIYFAYNKFAAFKFYFGPTSIATTEPFAWYVLGLPLSLVNPDWGIFIGLWGVAILLGLISLYPLFLYFDLIWKQKDTRFNADLFLFIGIMVHFIFFIGVIRGANDRWILMVMPYLFILAGKGLEMTYKFLSKYSVPVAAVVMGVLLLGGAVENFSHATSLINNKKDSYLEEKLAGEWLKANTSPGAKIITASIVQNQYYSDRESYDFFGINGTAPLFSIGCLDNAGNVLSNVTCQNESERLFDEKVASIKPDYFIVSIFEPVFTPAWVYTYPQRHNMTAVQGYTLKDNPQQPALVIYKFNK